MEILNAVFWFVIIISVLVFVHEMGHYLAGRYFNAIMPRFSIGMGPVIWAKKDKRGTEWAISALPLGGYVAFVDSQKENTNKDKTLYPNGRMLNEISRMGRAVILLAGPIFNLTLGIFAVMVWLSFNKVDITPAVVGDLVEEGVAIKNGIEKNDIILSINGEKIKYFENITQVMLTNLGYPTTILISRNGEQKSIFLTPQIQVEKTEGGRRIERGLLGIRSVDRVLGYTPVLEIPRRSVEISYRMVLMTAKSILQMVKGERSLDGLQGAVGIAETTHKASASWSTLLWVFAMLSLNLAFVNMLPLPMLDGGQLLVLGVEGAARKNLSEKIKNGIAVTGVGIIIIFMVFTFFQDLRFLNF